MTSKAPWNEKIVKALNHYQTNQSFHPYTCPERNNIEHREYAYNNAHRDHGVLIATENGWICPACDYTQDWYHHLPKE